MTTYEAWLARREEARWEGLRECDLCGELYERDDLTDGICTQCLEVAP